jgi:hypothetical protein
MLMARLTRAERQAHWFYEDFCRTTAQGRALRSFSLREFAELMFEQHPSLEQHKVWPALEVPTRRHWLWLLRIYTAPAGSTGWHIQAVHCVQGARTSLPAVGGARLTHRPQHNVPVFGAIMVNPAMDKCLMVKGWKSGASWGFPKGKVCAVPIWRRRRALPGANLDALCVAR